MPIVSNTSPVLNLAIIGRLDLLRQQFAEVIISTTVQAELLPHADAPGAEAIQAALRAGWLRAAPGGDPNLAHVLQVDLDSGEAATLALAVELAMQEVLMDERDGRRKAITLGLRPVGVVGVLLRGKRDGQVASVAQVLQMLRDEAGFYLEPDLVSAILRAAGE